MPPPSSFAATRGVERQGAWVKSLTPLLVLRICFRESKFRLNVSPSTMRSSLRTPAALLLIGLHYILTTIRADSTLIRANGICAWSMPLFFSIRRPSHFCD